ncbi:DUF927 domain-containing protein [Sinorhizobium sp. M4_45]|uniref:DUF927 domain-containing protein n=1 Tax=Sinorhizobium sp. M4_45 TaxID=2037901 RepID=UPI000C9BCBCB|nr:DUF927 domain-containing protein [Sinorhizobium sp. M4_45]PND27036.1 hypothetical protein CN933_15110 [Sinorhizobium sp. M4_45]
MSNKQPISIQVFDKVEVEGTPVPYCILEARDENSTIARALVDASALSDDRRCLRALIDGGLPTAYSRIKIRLLLDAASTTASASSTKVATRCGWHGNEYVLPHKTIGPANTKWVHKAVFSARTSLAAGGRLDQELCNFIEKRVKRSDYLLFATLLAFTSPILDLIGEREGCAFYPVGNSSTGKTTLLLMANALTQPLSSRRLRQFDFTPTGWEELCFEHNDNILCLDEISSLTEQQRKDLPKLVYTLANGMGKRRSKAASIAAEFPELSWRTLGFISGEQPVDTLPGRQQSSGQDARFIGINIPLREAGGIFGSPESFPPQKSEKYVRRLEKLCKTYNGDHFERWLHFLATDRHGITDRAKKLCDMYTNELAGDNADNLARRRARKFAVVAAVGHLLSESQIFRWSRDRPVRAIRRVFKASNELLKAGQPQHERAAQYARTLVSKIAVSHRFEGISHPGSKKPKNPLGILMKRSGRRVIAVLGNKVAEAFDEPNTKELESVLSMVTGLVQTSDNRSSMRQQIQFKGKSRASYLVLDQKTLLRLAASNLKAMKAFAKQEA